MSEFTVTDFWIADSDVPVKKIDDIRNIVANFGGRGVEAVFTASSGDEHAKKWTVLVLVIGGNVFVRSLTDTNGSTYELKQRDHDLYMTAV